MKYLLEDTAKLSLQFIAPAFRSGFGQRPV